MMYCQYEKNVFSGLLWPYTLISVDPIGNTSWVCVICIGTSRKTFKSCKNQQGRAQFCLDPTVCSNPFNLVQSSIQVTFKGESFYISLNELSKTDLHWYKMFLYLSFRYFTFVKLKQTFEEISIYLLGWMMKYWIKTSFQSLDDKDHHFPLVISSH